MVLLKLQEFSFQMPVQMGKQCAVLAQESYRRKDGAQQNLD